jgi:hypothetical protein
VAKFDLKTYARQGAAARVADLNEELASIYRTFPDLRADAKMPSATAPTRRRRAPRLSVAMSSLSDCRQETEAASPGSGMRKRKLAALFLRY